MQLDSLESPCKAHFLSRMSPLYFNFIAHSLFFQTFCQYKMFMLDRPLLPKYTKASLGSISSGTSGISSASSKNLSIHSQATVTTVCSVPPKANGKTLSRASSAASLGRPYQTISDEPMNQRKARSAPDKKKTEKKIKKKVNIYLRFKRYIL